MQNAIRVPKKMICGLMILFSFLSLQEAYSQSNIKALIKGVVLDAESKGPLPGATLLVVGSSNGTATNVDGEYSLFVSEGKLEIEVSYLGNETKIVNVEVVDGETKVVNIELEYGSQKLDEIVVRGILEGQQKALSQQRASDNLKNVISADQMGKFPDQNSAESLQRVSGVNVQRDEGDGRFVLVRGLAPQFTNISINGEQIPSPEGDSRFVALDAIPANQLASLEVSKSITPDMDGDAIGGSVNLITPKATKKKLTVSGATALEYNNSSEKATGQGNLTLSKRSKNNKFGIIVSGSYAESKKHSERYGFDKWGDDADNPEGLDEFEITDYEIERNRIGANATLDYKINDKSQIYFRTLYSELREIEERRRVVLEAENDDDDVLEYAAVKEFKYRPENQGVYSLNLGGTHTTPKFKLDYEAALSKAFQDTPENSQLIFENAEDVVWNLDTADPLNPKLTNFNYDGNTAKISDSSLYAFDAFETEQTKAEDQNLTFKANIAIPIKLGNKTGEIKFGGKTRFKDKDFTVNNYAEYGYEGDDDLFLTDFNDGTTFPDFMNGDFNESLGAFGDRDAFLDFQNANASDFEEDDVKALEEKTLQEYDASEDVFAGYIQGKLKIKKLLVLGGVRYEKTNFTYASGEWDEENEVAVPVVGENNYDFLLPMLHLKYTLSKDNIIRASATKSYSRPNFEDLVQGATFADDEATIFNPELSPVKAINLDLFGEHYFGNVGLISGGLFYKRLDDFIYQQTTERTFRGLENIEVTQAINGDQADLFGLEIGYQQNLTFLPGALKGLVIYANYTFTNSSATVTNFTQGEDLTEIDLPGQSKHVGNAAIAYNIGGFKARLSLNYNGSYISEFDDGQIVRIDNRKQVDLSMSQAIKKMKGIVFLELINLTDENQFELYNTRTTPKERQRFGSWGRLGLRFNL